MVIHCALRRSENLLPVGIVSSPVNGSQHAQSNVRIVDEEGSDLGAVTMSQSLSSIKVILNQITNQIQESRPDFFFEYGSNAHQFLAEASLFWVPCQEATSANHLRDEER